ncbi:MAG: aspartate kinase [Bacteroidetes bacterium]|nr:MAG: aspartate kinase [Bacteroidota bacterium]
MKVMKFGGTSVGKPERMQQVAELITATKQPKLVVLSALSGTTNTLVNISHALAHAQKQEAAQIITNLYTHYCQFIQELLPEPVYQEMGKKIVDEHFDFLQIILRISFSEALNKDILAQGELLSTKLFSVYLQSRSITHQLLPALEFMVIDANEEPDLAGIRSRLLPILAGHPDCPIFITQGYICRNVRGEVDNLKRGGSDYTASLVAAAVNAEVCEIWTDIDGMHNNDPRIVNKTRAIEFLSFEEAAELAYFGAKILHPTCIWPTQQENVPVKLLNTMQPEAKGTTIVAAVEESGPKAVAAKDGIYAIKIKSSRMLLAYGFLRKVFEVFEKYKTSIDMITTSEVAVSVTIDNTAHLDAIVKELTPFGQVEVMDQQSIIAIVGNQLATTPNILSTILQGLQPLPVTMVSFGGSEHNVSLLLPTQYRTQALQLLNTHVFGL